MAGVAKERLTMRVLVIAGSFPPMKCGVGDYSHNLARAIAAMPGTFVGVLTSRCEGRESTGCDGVEVFPVMDSWSLSEAFRVTKIIRSWSPDIVHVQYPTQAYASALLPWFLPLICFLMGNKVVQTWHEDLTARDVPKVLFKAMAPGGLVVVRPQYKERLGFFFRWALWNKKVEFIRNASVIPHIDLSEHRRGELRNKYLNGQQRIIVFFGFVNPNKGVELLFDIAKPDCDQIVIAGEIDEAGNYQQELAKRASIEPWQGNVTITGFLPSQDVAALLAVADAVILPFRCGGGEWNSSIHAAILQGTFVITTSLLQNGYDPRCNVYYANVDDVQAMKSALDVYAGKRREYDSDVDIDEWQQIAAEHRSLYEHILNDVDSRKPVYGK
jgi:glycosyltransferase involved in cell wall biosynthesis